MLWLILLLGTALRILNLLSNKAFWNDELFSVLLARKPFLDVFYGAVADVHPPGHLFVLHAFYSLFGDVDWSYRLPSVIAGSTLIVIVYLLAREFFEKASALLASFLIAISPYFMQLSNEARSYSLTVLLMTGMSYSFIKSFCGKISGSVGIWRRTYEISAILCAYIDHFTWIWLFMVNIFLLLNGKFKKCFSSHLRIFLFGLPALLLTTYQIFFSTEKTVQKYFVLMPSVKKIFAVLWHAATGYSYSGLSQESLAIYSADPFFWLAVIAYGSFLIAITIGVFKAPKHISLFVLLSSMVPMILLCFLYPTRLESRYVSFVVPPLIIFAAVGFRQLKYRWVWLSPIIVLSLYFTFKTLAMPWDPIHREDHRADIDYAFQVATKNDAVCGLKRQVEYYGPKEKKAVHYPYVYEIDFQKRYAKIYLLEPSLYVDPKRDSTRLDFARNILSKNGYSLTESIDFSKDGVNTFVHKFELK